jgi:hypothetical protein
LLTTAGSSSILAMPEAYKEIEKQNLFKLLIPIFESEGRDDYNI